MIRYFKYELKKNFWTLVVLTAIAVIIYVVTVSASELFYRYIPEQGVETKIINNTSQIGIIYAVLGVFCAVVPILMYSFKMEKRSVDVFYSLPIKKGKMYLVKTLVGLILVLVPYTIAYWLGFLSVALRENYFYLFYYIPGYFGGLFFGICLYGICAFSFTRANHEVDGVVFMLMYACIYPLILNAGMQIFDSLMQRNINIFYYFSFSGLISFGINVDTLIGNGPFDGFSADGWNTAMFLYPGLFAAAGYALMFLSLRWEKGENAEQNSDSWLGYRVLLPLYIVTLFMCVSSEILLVYGCLITIWAIIMTIVHTRKILFNWRYWVMIAASVAVGLVLNIIFL